MIFKPRQNDSKLVHAHVRKKRTILMMSMKDYIIYTEINVNEHVPIKDIHMFFLTDYYVLACASSKFRKTAF